MSLYANQIDLFNPARFGLPIHVIGLGGIGSALVYPLAKLGVPEIHLWDFDRVEASNLPSQLIYRQQDVGRLKVEAAADFLRRQEVECKIVPHVAKVTEDTCFDGIVMSGVDSMSSRKAIWEAVKESFPLVPLYLDGRIGGERWMLLTVDPFKPQAEEDYAGGFLFADEEVAELPCTARAIIHPAIALAGYMVDQLTLYAREEELAFNITANMNPPVLVAAK